MKKFTTPLVLFMLLIWLMPIDNLHAADTFDCELDFTLKPIGACGDDLGAIEVNISGGSGSYEICWVSNKNSIKEIRNISGSYFRISNLPGGAFSVRITDRSLKCRKVVHTFVDFNFLQGNFIVKGNPAQCHGEGSISFDITGNTAPYELTVKGPITQYGIATSNNFRIFNLPMGDYEIKLNKGDCEQVFHSTVGVEEGLPDFDLAAIKDDCGIDIGTVDAIIKAGRSPYQLSWEGPTKGSIKVDGSVSVPSLENGAYKFTLEDAKGCRAFQYLEIQSISLALSAAKVSKARNGRKGVVKLAIQGGVPDFSVTWNGHGESGERATIDRGESISLPVGTYDIEVMDAAGCSEMISVTIEEDGAGLGNGLGSLNQIANINSDNLLTNNQPIVHQNYPNPFNNQTNIPFILPKSMEVELIVQDHFGRVVMAKRELRGEGLQQFEINGSDLASGMFFYTIITDGFKMTKRMVVR